MPFHIRLVALGSPKRLHPFLSEINGWSATGAFSLNCAIPTPMPVPSDDIRAWRRFHWGSPHDAYNATVKVVDEWQIIIEFDCQERPYNALYTLMARHGYLSYHLECKAIKDMRKPDFKAAA